MAICYHEEYFALGFLSALFLVAIITIFENVITDIIKKLTKRSLNKRVFFRL